MVCVPVHLSICVPVQSLDEAITRANTTSYGLGAGTHTHTHINEEPCGSASLSVSVHLCEGICTRDIGKAFTLAHKIRAGTIYSNHRTHTTRQTHTHPLRVCSVATQSTATTCLRPRRRSADTNRAARGGQYATQIPASTHLKSHSCVCVCVCVCVCAVRWVRMLLTATWRRRPSFATSPSRNE